MKSLSIKRGDIILANLNPPEPAIQSGVRPCVVVSNNAHNMSHHPGIIICPITDAIKGIAEFPGHVIISCGIAGCTKDSVVMTEQIRLIRRSRIIEVKGHIPDEIINKLDYALRFVLSL